MVGTSAGSVATAAGCSTSLDGVFSGPPGVLLGAEGSLSGVVGVLSGPVGSLSAVASGEDVGSGLGLAGLVELSSVSLASNVPGAASRFFFSSSVSSGGASSSTGASVGASVGTSVGTSVGGASAGGSSTGASPSAGGTSSPSLPSSSWRGLTREAASAARFSRSCAAVTLFVLLSTHRVEGVSQSRHGIDYLSRWLLLLDRLELGDDLRLQVGELTFVEFGESVEHLLDAIHC